MTRASSRRRLWAFVAVVGLFALILGWWVVFFSGQGSRLVERLESQGAQLDAEQALMVREAADGAVRMLVFEGLFLGLLFMAGLFLVLRSLRQEVLLYRQRRNFLSAVTHELKSPIASARLYLESLQLERVPEGKRGLYLERAREELDRLRDLVDHLLETARAASGETEQAREAFDLAELTRRTVQDMAEREAVDVQVEFNTAEPVLVDADPRSVRTILGNLFSNAVKYGGDPPRLAVSVANGGGTGRLRVRDFGPGVSGREPQSLFEPFARGENELVREQPGVGLGLFLVAELAKANGGSVEAANAQDGSGFAVEVCLPLARRGGAA